MYYKQQSRQEASGDLVDIRKLNLELRSNLNQHKPVNTQFEHNNTQRKQVEEALRQSEQEKVDILENLTDAFYSIDSRWRFTYVNKAAEKAFGKQRDDVIGRFVNDVIPNFWPKFIPIYRQAIEEREPQRYENFCSVTQTWFDVIVYPFRDGVSICLRDIHHNKLLEQELQQKVALIEIAHDAILIRDLEGFITYWNNGSEHLYGWSKGEALGQTSPSFLKQPKESFVSAHRELLCLGSWKGELVHTTKEGRQVIVSSHQVLQRNKKGKPIAILEINRDITEQKRAEQALKESQQQMEQVIELLPDATLVINSLGQVVFWNKAMRDMTGITKEQIIGKGDYEYALPFYGERRPILIDLARIPDGEHHDIRNKYDNISHDGHNLSGEVNVPNTYGGKGAYLLGSASRLYDLKGNPSGAIQSIRDITDRKEAEKALRLSEERFSKAFMVSPIPMSISTEKDGVFLDVNDAYLQLAGYDREEMIGRSSLDLKLWSNANERARIVNRLRKGEKVKDVEFYYRTKQGHQRLVLLSMEPIILNNVDCVITMFIDITERRQMEKDMSRLDRLNLIGEMAASIGHEIRNPMTAIRGFLQLLRGKKQYLDDLIFFDLMIEELDRANAIITEYLSMAKDKIVNLQSQYLDEVVKSLYPLLQADANYQEKDVQLKLGKPPMPLIDAKEIRQLILNMARNGLEAMQPRGILTIGTAIEGNNIVLFIKDQGHGLDPALIDKLGTPFLTTKDKGTGLGLAVCYSIAARHNARIDFETGPEGTTFYVRFPAPAKPFELV